MEDGREERRVSAVSHRPSGVEETIRPSEPENGQVSRSSRLEVEVPEEKEGSRWERSSTWPTREKGNCGSGSFG